MPAKNKQSKTAKRRLTNNQMRTVEPEVTSDSKASNLLANKPKLTERSKVRKQKAGELKKELRSAKLYGKKKQREYKESDLDLPVLNKAIMPGTIKKKGKKGKKFIGDNDSITLNRLIKTINDDRDLVNESKLEKSRRLEEIRELRKQEMDRKEAEKVSKLEDKKQEIKNKSNVARALRRKNAKEAKKSIELSVKEVIGGKKRKSVSFA